MPKIALLGWGSLLWDKRPEFDNHHEAWQRGGPMLKIEFTRISETRLGALTLVIDPQNGARCEVSFALSTRSHPEDAICDLRCREGTTLKNIGYWFADGSKSQSRDKETLAAVSQWGHDKAVDVVVWTDLTSNFTQKSGMPFTIDNAVAHLQSLSAEAKAGAADYVWRAPDFMQTPLRKALENAPWFRE